MKPRRFPEHTVLINHCTKQKSWTEPRESPVAPPPEEIEAAGLIYATDNEPGISRRSKGKRFRYQLPSGRALKDTTTLKRIRALAIPPAWTEVWICPNANVHIQATGRDDRGRKQYRYHAAWALSRDESKFDRILTFAKILPKVRRTVRRHMRGSTLSH